ncbi:MAG: hypothetical protein Q4F57_09670 [Weeksellaceae bacterium]|nr:hypothetical protein [Weeksellaceae bacterium]
MQNYFQNETPEKTFGFKTILTFVALMIISHAALMVYNIVSPPISPDPTLFIPPLWYNILGSLLSITALVGLGMTYNYRKIGVYVVIASLLLIVVLNPEFSLLRTLVPVFTLFIFVGFGLLEIIPKWQFFR